MAWDSSRVVPWRRLVREWVVYAVFAAVVVSIYFVATDRKLEIGWLAGLLSSGPMYVAFGAILAKFGYQRKTLKQLKEERPVAAAARSSRSGSTTAPPARARPAPTKRTSTGPSQYRKNNKPKRR
jgi:hypothetical protein